MPSAIQGTAFTQPKELKNASSSRPVADLEYDERRFERQAENPLSLPKHNILGSISFQKVQDTLVDTGEAVVELARWITGAGTEAPDPIIRTEKTIYGEGNSQITQSQAESVQQEEATLRIRRIQNFFAEINTPQAAVEREQNMKESLRIIGRVATEEDAQKVGATREHIFRTSVLHEIAGAEAKVIEVVENQQKEAETSEVEGRIYGADMNRTFEDQNMGGPG